MAITSEGIGLALLAFVVCFIAAFVASRRQPARDRFRSGLFWGFLFGAAQLTRAAFDIHFEPPLSTILAFATGIMIVAGMLLLTRHLIFDGDD